MGVLMTEGVLVDSNVFIDLLRQKRNPVTVLDKWRGDRDFMTCGMVRLEVERGVVDSGIRNYMCRFFDLMRFVPTTNQLWAEAVELAWSLDRMGVVLPAADVIIAVHARKFGAAVLTSDGHFERIPGVRVYKPMEEIEGWE
jgi:predicted nucleic acid-binding protein